jgi:hypothetical protein
MIIIIVTAVETSNLINRILFEKQTVVHHLLQKWPLAPIPVQLKPVHTGKSS